jgi:hypothetical protein
MSAEAENRKSAGWYVARLVLLSRTLHASKGGSPYYEEGKS